MTVLMLLRGVFGKSLFVDKMPMVGNQRFWDENSAVNAEPLELFLLNVNSLDPVLRVGAQLIYSVLLTGLRSSSLLIDSKMKLVGECDEYAC
jgi:hypothetical protein